ncbi:glycosyltransferase family 15 protein [Heliocybe sulcata]|uniref:Glycosyltransferase family 15 protein n=1 Tax=Heliocybe sulcata TaxID=5364 RepID=A0A5C3NEF2_9AGAM|nr:glycosyltransferase family 15 protein [Heliocybe sulcata]
MKPTLAMINSRRYVLIVILLLLGFHYILRISHESYAKSTSLSRLVEQLSLNRTLLTDPYYNDHRRANATFVFLCRNSDLAGVVTSMQQMEDRFNRKYQYPWVLLNDEPFTDDFKKRVSVLTDAPIQFGVIPREQWVQPDWIDEKKAEVARKVMVWQRIIYGGMYRNMCRFNSGFFYRHELLLPYKYYWRVEPDVKFFCDVDYDPFLFMQEHNKTYGFTITMEEFKETIITLWDTTKEFLVDNPQYVAQDNALGFLSDDGGISYNLCHYWSNFEIADMDFWRGEAYAKYFDFLESKGGFYYERWGDAPVHSIAASLFLSKHQLHFFRDIGYRHEPFQHCPQDDDWSRGRCSCNPDDNFDYTPASCIRNFDRIF